MSPSAPLFLMDGPTGTELEARGYRSHEILWTARAAIDAEELLFAIHRDYALAGAQLLTANTFRTTSHAAARAGLSAQDGKRFLNAAVTLAQAAAQSVSSDGKMPPVVAGSLAPLADCYTPEATPEDAVLRSAHRQTAEWLLEASCDLLLIETQGSGREARIATAQAVHVARGTGTPIWVSLLPDASGESLLDGTSLVACAEDCARAGAGAILVNCADLFSTEAALEALQPLSSRGDSICIGAYQNAQSMTSVDGNRTWTASAGAGASDGAVGVDDRKRSQALVQAARRYLRQGATIFGACCGHRPDDIAALRAFLSGGRDVGAAALR